MILMLHLTVALLATLLACGIGAYAWRQRSFGVGCLALDGCTAIPPGNW
jgi:hypothetical protein